jgi:hypothetical protein
MRIRSVKPEFWADAKLAGLPLHVKLIYIGLWMEADDTGLLRWEPKQLALDLLHDQPESEALKLLSEASKALTRRGRLQRLKCGHALIPTLGKHQRFHSDPGRRSYTHRREHDSVCLRLQEGNRGEMPGGTPRHLPAREGREGKVRESKGVSLSTNSNGRGANGHAPSRLADIVDELNPELQAQIRRGSTGRGRAAIVGGADEPLA